MNLQTVQDNLKNTIAGKEEMLERSMERLRSHYTDRMDDITWFTIKSTIQLLEINIDELKKILADIETCAAVQSWRDNPDRSGGQFTEDEINNERYI